MADIPSSGSIMNAVWRFPSSCGTDRNGSGPGSDLTKSEDIAVVADRLAKDASITALVNNAGMMLPGAFLDNDVKGTTNLITLNVTAPTLLASAAAKAFLSRKQGTIINIGSVDGENAPDLLLLFRHTPRKNFGQSAADSPLWLSAWRFHAASTAGCLGCDFRIKKDADSSFESTA